MANRTIKIIKRTERESIENEQMESAQEASGKDSKSVVQTVSDWVSELKRKKRLDRADSYKHMFQQTA